MKNIILSFFLFFSLNSNQVFAKNYCPEKILDTLVVEGKYVGVECGDMCYATILLNNSEEFSFLCGEDDANKYLGSPGTQVKVTVNIEQFWNEYGNECSRVEVFKSAEVILPPSLSSDFDYGQCMDNSGGVTIEMINCMQASISVLEKSIIYNIEKSKSSCIDDSCKQSLVNAQNAWELYVKEMSQFLLINNDETSSASRIIALSFIREEMARFSELILPKEF